MAAWAYGTKLIAFEPDNTKTFMATCLVLVWHKQDDIFQFKVAGIMPAIESARVRYPLKPTPLQMAKRYKTYPPEQENYHEHTNRGYICPQPAAHVLANS